MKIESALKKFTFPVLILSALSLRADPPAVEQFAKRIEIHNAVLSPGGNYIALERSADEGKKLIAIVDVKALELKGYVPAGSEKSPFAPFWVNDKRLIVHMTQDISGADFEQPNGELIALDYNGKKQREIIEHQVSSSGQQLKRLNALHGFAEVVHRLPQEKNHVLISFVPFEYRKYGYKPELYRIHITSGKVKRVAEAPSYHATFLFNPAGEPRYSIGLDEAAMKAGENEWVTHRYDAGDWKKLRAFQLDASSFEIISTDAKGNAYLRTGYEDKPDRIYRYNFESGEQTLLFAHAEVDPLAYDLDPKTGELLAVHFEDGYPNLHLLNEDHPLTRWYPALFKAFNGKRVRITSASADYGLLLLHISGDREPGQYRLFSTKNRDMRYLFQAAPWIKPDQLAESKPIAFESRDGHKIHGFLTLPKPDATAAPLVVLPHGGPYHVQDLWRYDPEVQLLASRGYAVLQINFRGSDGYGWGFSEAGYRAWGSDIQYDIIDGAQWAASLPSISADRMCIMGSSFGGYSALMTPTLAPNLFRCAISNAGPYDLELMWKTADIKDSRYGENYLERAIGTDPEVLASQSPLHRLDKLTIPVMLAHGGRDWRVDDKHFHRMVKALKSKDHPHETFYVKDEGHGFHKEENRKDYLQQAVMFLDKHLKD